MFGFNVPWRERKEQSERARGLAQALRHERTVAQQLETTMAQQYNSTSNNCWYNWVNTTGTASTTSNSTWNMWCTTGTTTTAYAGGTISQQQRQQTVEELTAQEARYAEHRRLQTIENEQRRRAHDRAEAMLLENLTPAQKKSYKDNRFFVVQGGKSKQEYRINARGSLAANIDVIEGDKIKHRICAAPDYMACPYGDAILAQKLWLEHSEEDMLKVAIVHHIPSYVAVAA